MTAPCHPAHGIDLADGLPGGVGKRSGQALHIVGTRQRVDDVRNAGLVLKDELRVARESRALLGRQRNRLVEAVGVQRLGAAEDRGHGLIRGSHHVVVGILLLQRDAGRLAVRAQHQGTRIPGFEFLHDSRPQEAGGAELRRLHEEVHADREKERQAAGEGIHVHATRERGLNVLLAVCEREGEFLHQRRAGFLHVVPGNRHGIEPRHSVRRVFDDVGNDAHGRLRRINERVPNHEFLQDVVLNRPR